MSNNYRKTLNKYKKAVRQRNAALETRNLKLVEPWTDQTAESGAVLIEERTNFFKLLDQEINEVESSLGMKFESSVELSGVFEESAEERFRAVLEQNIQKDMSRCTTTSGPHRDDWTILKDRKQEQDLRHYGSRGEQRMGILSMFIGILGVIRQAVGSAPILLLDDLFSELDADNQTKLFEMISVPDFQVIATSTPNTYKEISKQLPKDNKIIRLGSNG